MKTTVWLHVFYMTIYDVKDQRCKSFHLNYHSHTGAELLQSTILYTDFDLRGQVLGITQCYVKELKRL